MCTSLVESYKDLRARPMPIRHGIGNLMKYCRIIINSDVEATIAIATAADPGDAAAAASATSPTFAIAAAASV